MPNILQRNRFYSFCRNLQSNRQPFAHEISESHWYLHVTSNISFYPCFTLYIVISPRILLFMYILLTVDNALLIKYNKQVIKQLRTIFLNDNFNFIPQLAFSVCKKFCLKYRLLLLYVLKKKDNGINQSIYRYTNHSLNQSTF